MKKGYGEEEGQSRKYFLSNGKLHDISKQGRLSTVTSFFSNTDIFSGCMSTKVKTGKFKYK